MLPPIWMSFNLSLKRARLRVFFFSPGEERQAVFNVSVCSSLATLNILTVTFHFCGTCPLFFSFSHLFSLPYLTRSLPTHLFLSFCRPSSHSITHSLPERDLALKIDVFCILPILLALCCYQMNDWQGKFLRSLLSLKDWMPNPASYLFELFRIWWAH